MAAFDGAASMVWAATGSGCGVLHDHGVDLRINVAWDPPDLNRLCKTFNAAAVATLQEQLQPCDIVIIHQQRQKFDCGDECDPGGLVSYLRAWQNIVETRGASFVLLGDGIRLPERGIYCTEPALRPQCSLSLDTNSLADDVLMASVAQTGQSSYHFPIAHLFCSGYECNAQIPGTDVLAYYDDQHLTSAGALYLVPFLCAFFTDAGLLGTP